MGQSGTLPLIVSMAMIIHPRPPCVSKHADTHAHTLTRTHTHTHRLTDSLPCVNQGLFGGVGPCRCERKWVKKETEPPLSFFLTHFFCIHPLIHVTRHVLLHVLTLGAGISLCQNSMYCLVVSSASGCQPKQSLLSPGLCVNIFSFRGRRQLPEVVRHHLSLKKGAACL